MCGDFKTMQNPRYNILISSLQEFSLSIFLQSAILIQKWYFKHSINVLVLAVIVMIIAVIIFRLSIFEDMYRIAQNDTIVNEIQDLDIRKQTWLQGAADAYNLFFRKYDILYHRFLFMYHQVICILLLLQILL